MDLELHSLYLLYRANEPQLRIVGSERDLLTDSIQILQNRDYEENGPSTVATEDLFEGSPLLSRRPAA